MRRLIGPVGLMLFGALTGPLTAQQSRREPVVTVEDPRPLPVLPAALIPFTVGSEVCRNGHTPAVTMKVYNVLTQPVATLRLRSRGRELIDELTMRCGTFVAIWDGVIAGSGDGGERVAPPGVYYLRLIVNGRDGVHRDVRRVIVPQT